ncbi:zinc-dependent metalloprotease [Schaalia sp. ZJ1691]|uniref:zinc-dependent metalloprotease n=1 Tax=Schaalia sp. ZJ1691 TaxID=2709404 RepID=UPI0013EBD7CD|nr:zinc-dependent metalloprotease [Schaalia sp. ZJ1691]
MRTYDMYRALTPAGPKVAPYHAQAIVSRLRESLHWANRRLAQISGFEDEAAAVTSRPTRIANRHGALAVTYRLLAEAVSRADVAAASIGQRIRRETTHARAASLVANAACGLWDFQRDERILIAPNVLVDAERFALDQKDWCRWVALRTGLRGVYFERAPFLPGVLASGALNSQPEEDDSLDALTVTDTALLVDILDVLPTLQMTCLSPRDLPSVHWILSHRLYGVGPACVRLFAPATQTSQTDPSLTLRAQRFAQFLVDQHAVTDFFASPQALPRAREVEDPLRWLDRVRG